MRSGGTPRARSVHAPSLCNAAPQSPLLHPQAKKDASRFRALVLIISVAAAFSAGFNPYVTKPRVASKLAETEHADVCPPNWLPMLLAARPSHIDSPAPRFDDEALPFEEDNELLSMKRRMTETDCVSAAEIWACHRKCAQEHMDWTTSTPRQPDHDNCKKACMGRTDYMDIICSPSPPPPSPSPPPSPPSPPPSPKPPLPLPPSTPPTPPPSECVGPNVTISSLGPDYACQVSPIYGMTMQ